MSKKTIKQFRKSIPMTQEQFANLIGINIKVVSRWESGIAKPSIQSRIKINEIAKSYNVEINYKD